MLDGDSLNNKIDLLSFPHVTSLQFPFSNLWRKIYHISIATQSLFLETNQILFQKKLIVIKFRKIYNFEGKNGDDEENINFDLKKWW